MRIVAQNQPDPIFQTLCFWLLGVPHQEELRRRWFFLKLVPSDVTLFHDGVEYRDVPKTRASSLLTKNEVRKVIINFEK